MAWHFYKQILNIQFYHSCTWTLSSEMEKNIQPGKTYKLLYMYSPIFTVWFLRVRLWCLVDRCSFESEASVSNTTNKTSCSIACNPWISISEWQRFQENFSSTRCSDQNDKISLTVLWSIKYESLLQIHLTITLQYFILNIRASVFLAIFVLKSEQVRSKTDA